MFIKSSIIAVALIPVALSRMILIERDGRPFYPRRFGQEQCGGIGGELGSTCAGQICGVLGGRVPGVLLAAADACAQQDLADDIIDASKDQDATTASKMVSIAVRVRQCEKNTPPDFTKNPPALRNSVFCLKAPRNSRLDGLVQGQDPANDPTLFFDPATKSTVLKGSQANTFPFGQAPANLSADSSASPDPSSTTAPNASSSPSPVINAVSTDACPAPSTVTVTATATPGPVIAAVETSSCNAPSTVTATITIDPASPSSVNKVAEVSSSSSAPSTTSSPTTGSSSQVIDDTSGALDFGSCTPSGVEFGPAFDGRKLSEFSFEPQDRTTFAQSSALNGQIVLNAFCNILNDKCKAPAATVTACKNAITAVANVTGGAKADGFNLALGIKTNFADIPAAPGGGPGSAALATQANFNKCDVPQLAFGIFDGRTENSFEPVGNGFVHGSALNPSIITTFICNTLVNSCDANQVAQDDCQAAIQATNGKTGQAVADAFNAAIKAHVA